MKRRPHLDRTYTLVVIVGGLVLGSLLLALFLVGMVFFRPATSEMTALTPAVTLIPAPTLTRAVPTVEPNTAATPTLSSSQLPPSGGPIKLGSYVQITNTGGVGLRIRSAPGTTSQQLFLGMESEVFQVTSGPKEADGYTWWYLVAPYDKKRAGWAASDYLTPIKLP